MLSYSFYLFDSTAHVFQNKETQFHAAKLIVAFLERLEINLSITTLSRVSNMERPTIGIIGLGPVGFILAAHLAKQGEDIVVEDIVQELLTAIAEEGLRLTVITDLFAY